MDARERKRDRKSNTCDGIVGAGSQEWRLANHLRTEHDCSSRAVGKRGAINGPAVRLNTRRCLLWARARTHPVSKQRLIIADGLSATLTLGLLQVCPQFGHNRRNDQAR